jgi:predicted nucleic acid-binding protein
MPALLDTNVLGYLLDSGRKEKIARRLAGEQPHISVQVLNEFVAVCKKCGKDRETAYQLADAIANASTVHEITLSTYRLAQALATRYQLSHWDGLIVAAAILAQCETLYSEDMQHGQVIGTVKVVNPFK